MPSRKPSNLKVNWQSCRSKRYGLLSSEVSNIFEPVQSTSPWIVPQHRWPRIVEEKRGDCIVFKKLMPHVTEANIPRGCGICDIYNLYPGYFSLHQVQIVCDKLSKCWFSCFKMGAAKLSPCNLLFYFFFIFRCKLIHTNIKDLLKSLYIT